MTLLKRKLIVSFFSLAVCLSPLQNLDSKNKEEATDAKIEKLSKKLGISINEDSEHVALYAEAAKWLGTRYKMGGMSFKGVDCSGFTGSVYNAVYDKQLQRRSADMAKGVQQTVSKKDLKTGDLVFFSTSRRGKGINHVGIYLKDNKFIHASCSQGVIVSSLNEEYYKRTWQKGGRIYSLEKKSKDETICENINNKKPLKPKKKLVAKNSKKTNKKLVASNAKNKKLQASSKIKTKKKRS